MDALLIVVRLSLATIFAVAALAKVSKRAESVATLQEFGVSTRYGGLLAHGLPAAELSIAILLLPATTARIGASLATVLLVIFSAAIAVNLHNGRRPKCNCFGQVNAKPIGPQTLLRNSLLISSAALVALLGPGGSLSMLTPSRIDARLAADAFLLLLAGALLWMTVQLFRQQGRMLARIDVLELRLDEALGPMPLKSAPLGISGLPPGTAAPVFELESLAGQRVGLRQLLSTSSQLILLFIDPGCSPCLSLVPQVRIWQRQYGGSAPVIAIARGKKEDIREKYGQLGAQSVLLQIDDEVSREYQIAGTPAAILVDSNGEIRAQTAFGGEAIIQLLADTAARVDVSQPAVAPVLSATV
jgi:thiol-disulfide isomerase/thioredoxin